MAREIKITLNRSTNEYGVRGIFDATTKSEIVIAARWQDSDGVKSFALDSEAKAFLDTQVGYQTTENSNREELLIFCTNTAHRAPYWYEG